MPRKSEADQYTKFLDSQSADLASGNTNVKPKTSGAKRPGRPKKENVSGSSPFLGRVAATGKITKNNLKKNLEASYTSNLKSRDEWLAKGINYIKEATKNDDFQKDLDYDYAQAQSNLVIDENDMKEFERINKMNSNQIDKLEETEIENQYQPLGKNEKDELGFGIKNNQSFTGNPFDLDFGKILETQKTDSNILIPKSSLDINQLEKLGNLKYIISDILSGDTKALNDPTFTAMGLANVKLAIEWLLENQGLTNSGMQGLITEPWRLVYRRRPPTMEEFLTEEYIGPDAETLYPWVRQMLIDGFDPSTPHRNLIWYYFIGGGKSTASVMSNLYISLCNSLMWHQYKYYGHATTSIYTQVYIAGSMKKSSELLLEPMMNLLDSSPFFERCRALSLDSKFYSPKGIILNKDIKVGDEIYDHNGQLTRVEEVSPQGLTRVFEVIFEDGRKVKTNPEHLWKVQCSGVSKIMETQEIKKSLETTTYRWGVPLCKPVGFPNKNHILSPYILGFWLGGGTYNTRHCIAEFSQDPKDEETINRLRKELPENYEIIHRPSSKWIYAVRKIDKYRKSKALKNVFRSEFERLNLSGTRFDTKFIPEEYLYDSVENRIALLQGLMDSDGTFSKKSTSKTTITLCNEKLIDQIAWLVRSLGGIAYKYYIRYKKPNPKHKQEIRLDISFPDLSFNPFYLKRKAKAYEEYFNSLTKHRKTVHIKEIKEVEMEETQCIRVSNSEHLFLTDNFIVTHNSKQQMEEGMRVFEESGDKIDRIYWTTASPTSSIEMSGGSRYKLISNPGQLLGQNIISATMSEITFLITDFHWALDLNEKVYTSAKGDYKLMKDIEIGDKVLTPSGELSEVVKTALWENDDEYEIEFDNGKKIKCNGDHLWKAVCTDENGDKFTHLVTTRFILSHPEMEFDIPEFDFTSLSN